MSVTIKDIAKFAGVSRGTVDRVLHNRGGVNKQVEQRVKAIAESMGYIPNKAGKALAASKQPITIGCFIPSIENEFFDDIIIGIKSAEQDLKDFGVNVIIKQTKGYDVHDHINCINELRQKNCNGLCISTIDTVVMQDFVNEIIESGIPVIALNNDITNTKRLCYVGVDYTKSGSTAAGMLALCKATSINVLIITGSHEIKGHNLRIEGFMNSLHKNNISVNVACIIEAFDNDEISYEQTLQYLKLNNNIDCIYVTGGGQYGVCKAVEKLNVKNKLWLLCFDDIKKARPFLENGTIDFTICQEPIEQGNICINYMFSYFISGKKVIPADHITKNFILIKENL